MRYISFFLTFLIFQSSFAQTDLSESSFKIISKNIAHKYNLVDAENNLQRMYNLAVDKNNQTAKVRCLYYKMLIKDAKTEDSLFFKNSAAIENELEQTIFTTPASMLHLIIAKRLTYFKNYYHNRPKAALFKNEKGLPTYNTFSTSQLDSTINFHFIKAIELSKYNHGEKVEEFIWLSKNPLLFLYKPILYDVANAEYISYAKANRYLYIQNADYLKLSQDELLQQADTLKTFDTETKKIITLYKNWASVYNQKPQAYYYIEALLRLYLNQFTYGENKQKFYDDYLSILLQSPYNTVKAAGLFYSIKNKIQQATYYNNSDGYNVPLPTYSFDTSKRLLYLDAQSLYKQNKAVLDSFGYLKEDIESDFYQAQKPVVKAWVKNYQLPTVQPSLYVRYKNCTGLQIKISPLASSYSLQNKPDSIQRRLIKNLPILKQQTINLPDLKDWQYHNVNINIDELPKGSYVLQYKTTNNLDSTATFEHTFLTITNTAVINNDDKVFVLDRTTGKPLQNAKVTFGSIKNNEQDFSGKTAFVNAQGFVVNREDDGFVRVINKADTSYFSVNTKDEEDEKPENAFSKDEYDTKEEYYEEKLNLQFFTDRAIYRPGQTVYFKGIASVPDVNTGKPLPLSIQNLKLPFFQKLYVKILKAFTKKRPEVYITDGYGKEVDTIKFIPNKFGSFWGKYVIPKNAPTGDWSFEHDYYDGYGNKGDFKVEEYKRPSYEITIEKPTKELYLTDSVEVKVKVKSFAGVQLSDVRIEYTVKKTYSNGLKEKFSFINNDVSTIDTVGYTNAKGELLIKIGADTQVAKLFLKDSLDYDIGYRIVATAIDQTGESYDANTDFLIRKQPIRINDNFNRWIDNNNIPPIKITTKHNLSGIVDKMVKVQLFKINQPKIENATNDLPQDVDVITGLYKPQITKTESKTEEVLQYETTVKSNTNGLIIPKSKLIAGSYVAKYYCMQNGEIIGTWTNYFKVFDTKNNTLANNQAFDFLPYTALKNEDSIKWILGNNAKDIYSIYHISYFAKNNKKNTLQNDYVFVNETNGIKTFTYKVPSNAVNRIIINRLYILQNELVKDDVTVYVDNEKETKPEIIVEKFRTTLVPGGSETFKVSIKTKNKNTLAELMSTMYDASLDKIEKHRWEIPYESKNYYIADNWNGSISSFSTTNYFNNNYLINTIYNYPAHKRKGEALWWLNPLDYAYDEVGKIKNNNTVSAKMAVDDFNPQNLFGGRSAGLNEVVVVGYGVNIQKGLQGKVAGLNVISTNAGAFGSSPTITLRGIRSLAGNDKPLFILDGVPFDGDVSTVQTSSITDIVVLKGASATILYGEAGANGAVFISTKGLIQLPLPPEPQLIVRKNFNETAFFFPAIHADANGFYTMEFTMPQSVTEWKWKLFAHTKKMDYSYLEKTIYTQLPLMVQPNVPRFLYQGDKINLQSRISNLDTASTTGKIEYSIEDAVTGENLTSKIITQTNNDFTIAAQSNVTKGFYLTIPSTLLNPIKIIVKAIRKNFADGEEYIIPILTKKILATQTQPFNFSTPQITLPAPALPTDAQPYAQGIAEQAQPQAAMVNALPGLAFYNFNCAEQLSGKLLAYTTAIHLMRKDSVLRNSYINLNNNNYESLQQLPNEINEETMPWLQLQKYTTKHQQQLVKLLDTINAKVEINKLLAELILLQNSDGGFSWFKGGKTDKYISEYLLQAFGKMNKLYDFQFYNNFITALKKLIVYLDEANNNYEAINNQYIYGRGFWVNEYPLMNEQRNKISMYIKSKWSTAKQQNLYNQAQLILNTFSFIDDKGPEHEQAVLLLESIKQQSINDEEKGIRWKDLADEDDLSTHSEETVVMLYNALKASGNGTLYTNGIIKWLLTAKENDSWASTKSTAAVVNLLNENKVLLNNTTTVSTTVGTTKIEATNNLLQNNIANIAIVNQSSFQNNTTLTQQSSTTAKGNVLYYYFTENLPTNNTNILLKKELFYFDKLTRQNELVTTATKLKAGDKLTVTLTIETKKPLSYVFIEDKRAAAFEPVDNLSGYEYGNSIGYYKSVRDIGVQFFANQITPGKHTISYEVTIMKEGTFANGIASLQCMYKPSVKVYSKSEVANVMIR
jgi:alpha-2-macroglobulin